MYFPVESSRSTLRLLTMCEPGIARGIGAARIGVLTMLPADLS